MAHSRHVAKLAGSIFAQLAERYELNPLDRPLLEAAAKLQDVGYLINYDQHHKHSYHLILHSRLEGFQPNELELIANVARYHRGAEPKRKHANFRQLSARDRRARAPDGRHPARGRRTGPQQHAASHRRHRRVDKQGRSTLLRHRRQTVSRSRHLGRPQARQAVRKGVRHRRLPIEWDERRQATPAVTPQTLRQRTSSADRDARQARQTRLTLTTVALSPCCEFNSKPVARPCGRYVDQVAGDQRHLSQLGGRQIAGQPVNVDAQPRGVVGRKVLAERAP